LLEGWLEQREALEERLAAHIPELALRRRLRAVDTAQVGAALAPGWALVDFVHFRESDFRTVFARHAPRGAVAASDHHAPPAEPAGPVGRYVAFVLRAGETGPRLVDLGPAGPIEQLAVAWRGQLSQAEAAVGTEQGMALRAALLDAVLPLVRDCRGLVLA